MLESIFSRRSVRRYQDKPVESEKLEEVLKAGMYAPSAKNQQPWHFIVCDDKKVIEEVKNLHSYAVSLATAPIAILVCGDTKLEFLEGFYHVDCSAAIQNMLIAAKELGLDTCWMGIFPKEDLEESFSKYFNLPENVKPHSMIALGYADQNIPMPERFDKTRIHFNKW